MFTSLMPCQVLNDARLIAKEHQLALTSAQAAGGRCPRSMPGMCVAVLLWPAGRCKTCAGADGQPFWCWLASAYNPCPGQGVALLEQCPLLQGTCPARCASQGPSWLWSPCPQCPTGSRSSASGSLRCASQACSAALVPGSQATPDPALVPIRPRSSASGSLGVMVKLAQQCQCLAFMPHLILHALYQPCWH